MQVTIPALVLLASCGAAAAETRTVRLLSTTDVHARVFPWDYYTAKEKPLGLAKAATLIAAARAENPDALLVDVGDTIMGTPLASVYQSWVRRGALAVPLDVPPGVLTADPMMLAMNRLGYAAMAVGNHEFNFGLAVLDRARSDAGFPWLAANIVPERAGAARPFQPYLVTTVGGVTVAVIGICTPSVTRWEAAENFAGYRFLDGVAAAKATVAELRRREKPDLVVLLAHAGLGRDLETGSEDDYGSPRGENMVYRLATEVAGLDAIVFGHTHGEVEGQVIAGCLVQQPAEWAKAVGQIDFVMARDGERWRLVRREPRLLRVTSETPADAGVLAAVRGHHELTERFLDTPVTTSPRPLSGRVARFEDTALVDAINQVQLHYAKADVSFSALFLPSVEIPRGPVTVRQLAALYIYENELYALAGTGRTVRQALENSARFFLTCPDRSCASGPLLNARVFGFNYDMAAGVDYEIDLRRPPGRRISSLRFRGRPLEDGTKLRIAVNNYRAGGSGGYTMFRGLPVAWRSEREVRDLLVEYYTEGRALPAEPDSNWRIVPAAAVPLLRAEATRMVR